MDTVSVAVDGTKTETVSNYNASGTTYLSGTVTTTSADGRDITVCHDGSNRNAATKEMTLTTVGAYGSYEWMEYN